LIFRLLLPILGLLLLLASPLAAQQPDTLRYALPAPPVGTQATGLLGFSTAVGGGYVVVGAPFDDLGGSDSGVVKVFDSATGALLHVIPNPTPAVEDQFGAAVAISGTRVVVGAWRDNTGAPDAGCAYVFDLASATPTVPVATLPNPTPATSDYFGVAVAISGTRVVVGTWRDDEGANNAGAAWVFDLTSGNPSVPVHALANPSPAADDQFGYAVAIDGTGVVVGCYGDDTGATDAGSAYVYNLAGGSPTVPVLMLSNPVPMSGDIFGYTVAISGTRVAVGATWDDVDLVSNAGSVYVYDVAGGTPTMPVATMNNPLPGSGDWFGSALAISGTRVVVGTPYDNTAAADDGSAYLYDLTSGTPGTPVLTLPNPTPAANDWYGSAVAIEGTRVVVGAPYDDTGATDAGSAYVYNVSSGTPAVPVLTLNNPGPALGDRFGSAIAVSGTRVVVGAPYADTGATDAGSAFVYDLAGGTPTVPAVTLNNPSPAAGDQFGIAVAISGTRVVVGANSDDTGAANAGSAYVYDVSGGTPAVPVVTLNNPAPVAGDNFGIAVAISGTRVLVGANLDDAGTTDAGSAYVYDVASGSPATPVLTLPNPSPAAGDGFGSAVALDGTLAVIGANSDDTGATDAGSAYVYDLISGTPTVPARVLNNPSPAVGDNFGVAVAIWGTRVVVGANLDDTGAANAGSAYVYDLISGTPTVPVWTFSNPSPAADDRFGIAVAISGTRVLVGASQDDAGAGDAGSAYVYDVSGGTPTVPVATLANPSPAVGDLFGHAVAIDGTTAALGAPYDDAVITDKGFAYVFGPSIPDIQVEAPLGNIVLSGVPGASYGMQSVEAGPMPGRTHRITNTGEGTLTGLVLTITGPAAADFTPSALPPTTLAPGASFEFTVVFDPTMPGARAATLSLASNDPDENPFTIPLSGTGLTVQEAWRLQYFLTIENTGNAADAADPDGDGQNNLFEFVAGLVPDSAASRFAVRIAPVAGQLGQKAVVFGPVLGGRTYVVKSRASLNAGTWEVLGSFTTSDNGSERTVTDLGAGTGARFYTVEIARP